MKKRQVIIASAAIIILLTWIVWGILVFGEHRVTGKATSVATIGLIVIGDLQPLNLTNGWNFVSFYVQFNNYSVTNVLAPIDGYYDYIQEWDSDAQDFKIWSRLGLKEFTEFNKNKSYFIYMNTNQLITLNGVFFQNWTINLSSGWETPNYIFNYPTNITGAGANEFANITFNYMQKWNASNQDFLIYSPVSLDNSFNYVNESEGYFILTDGGQLVYIHN